MSSQTRPASAVFHVLTVAKDYLGVKTILWMNGFMDFGYKYVYLLHNLCLCRRKNFQASVEIYKIGERSSKFWTVLFPGTAWLLIMTVLQQFRNDPYYANRTSADYCLYMVAWMDHQYHIYGTRSNGDVQNNVKSPF